MLKRLTRGLDRTKKRIRASRTAANKWIARARRAAIARWLVAKRLALATAMILASIGVWLVWPSIAPVGDPPPSWGLWVGVTYPSRSQPKLATQLFARMSLKTDGCTDKTKLTGTLANLEPPAGQPVARPATILLVTAGPEARSGTVHQEGVSRPAPLAVESHKGGSALHAEVLWDGTRPLEITVQLASVGRPAGYGGCYVTSPQLFDSSTVNAAWEIAHRAADAYSHTHSRTPFDPAKLVAGVLDVSVRHKVPDRGAIDANGVIADQAVRVECSLSTPATDEEVSAALVLQAATRSNCGSTQTFHASDAATILNARVFGAGLALSAAVAILLEAIFSDHRTRSTRKRP